MASDAKVMHADQITSHSLRRGSITEAAYRGEPMKVLMDHGHWRSLRARERPQAEGE